MAEFGVSFGSSGLTSMLQERLAGVRADKVQAQESPSAAAPAQGGSSQNFMETLKSAIGEVNESIVSADKASRDFSTGKAENLHDVLISMEKADVSLRTLTSIRSKVVEAYQEIMRMPV